MWSDASATVHHLDRHCWLLTLAWMWEGKDILHQAFDGLMFRTALHDPERPDKVSCHRA